MYDVHVLSVHVKQHFVHTCSVLMVWLHTGSAGFRLSSRKLLEEPEWGDGEMGRETTPGVEPEYDID